MLEFAFPSKASGKWSVYVVGSTYIPTGYDATGERIETSSDYPNPLPIGVHIGPAGSSSFDTILSASTIIEIDPGSGGAFTGTGVVTAIPAVDQSLYVYYATSIPFGLPWTLAIYNVTAEPLSTPLRSRPGKRRAHFS